MGIERHVSPTKKCTTTKNITKNITKNVFTRAKSTDARLERRNTVIQRGLYATLPSTGRRIKKRQSDERRFVGVVRKSDRLREGLPISQRKGTRGHARSAILSSAFISRQINATKDSERRARYNNPVKQSHRAYLAHLAANLNDDKRPIVYLDDGGMCTQALLLSGVPSEQCKPVDRKDDGACERQTGVECLKADIEQIAYRAIPGEYAVMWFDLTTNQVPQITEFVHAAPEIMITMSMYGQTSQDVLQRLKNAIKQVPGAKIKCSGSYVGSGGKQTTMVFAFFSHPAKHRIERTQRKVPTDCSRSNSPVTTIDVDLDEECSAWMFVPLEVPLTRWSDAGLHFDTSSYVVNNNCLRAVVFHYEENELFLQYQTKGGRMVADQRQFERRMPKVTPAVAREWLL